MALTRNSRNEITTQEIALEIVKAALAGGALGAKEAEDGDPLKAVAAKATLDAVYAVRLYQTVLARLERPQVKKATP